MKIIYSPFYSSGYYIDLAKRQSDLLGLKVCGSRELLSELELRAGIVSLELSEPERLIDFHKAVKKSIHGSIFEESFNSDEVGVSRQLMAWCDSLLMEGWTPELTQPTDKLGDLAKMVKETECKHISTRWTELANYLKDHKVLQTDDCVEVHDKEHIPAVIRKALDELAKQTTVNYIDNESAREVSFELYQFKTRFDAYQWYLSKPDALQNTNVTVSSDNCILNDMAMAMGLPVVNSTAVKSNPQLLQLFKLGMSLFVRPLNVYNLLSYLQVPGNPLGGISYKLAHVLSDEGGINESWEKTIDEYDFTDDAGKDKRKDKLAFIEMVSKDYESDRIPVDDIKKYANKLAHWCDQLLRVKDTDDERKEQLVVLASFCRSLLQILLEDEYITSETLMAHVNGIYRPQSFTHMRAQKDAPDTIASVTHLADDADKVCWLGCVGNTLPPYPFDFLNSAELDHLEQNGILIPKKPVFYTRHHKQEMNALNHIRELILVTWEFDGNARQEEHPLITELKHKHVNDWKSHVTVDAVPNLEEETSGIAKLDPQDKYTLSSDLENIKREKESYSSISTLIQHPFDYTMSYLLNLQEPQVGQLPDLDTTKGLVAHLFVEKLFETYREQMAEEYPKLDESTIKQLIGEAIQEKGAVLLLPEYKLERQQFETILKKSIEVLTNIIRHLGLKPIGSEVEVNVELDGIGQFNGSIDMALEDANEKIVIFDFKWSEAKHYSTDLEENKAIQLELYRKAAGQHFKRQIAGVAYYLFPMMTMFTTDFDESDNIRKMKMKAEAAQRNLFEEIKNSYDYRRHYELDKGIIEESEMMEIAGLPYTTADTPSPRYSLDGAYKNEDLKSCPYVKVDKPPFAKKKAMWNTQKSDPKEIKTTHPILKGRLV